jgi:hypothetical protein
MNVLYLNSQKKLMKRFLPFIALLFAASLASGQLVTLYNNQNIYTGAVTDSEISVLGWEVLNATSSTIDFGCKRIGIQETPGHTSQFCWGIICSPFGTGNNTSSEIVSLAPGAYTNTFYAHFRPNGVAGQTTIRYCWFDSNNPADEFCYDVNFCIDSECIVSVSEKAADAEISKISPNPIHGLGNITYEFQSVPHQGKMTIYNALGAVVKEISLNKKSGVVIIDGNEFENGIYFCAIEDAGKTFETKKLVISH